MGRDVGYVMSVCLRWEKSLERAKREEGLIWELVVETGGFLEEGMLVFFLVTVIANFNVGHLDPLSLLFVVLFRWWRWGEGSNCLSCPQDWRSSRLRWTSNRNPIPQLPRHNKRTIFTRVSAKVRSRV